MVDGKIRNGLTLGKLLLVIAIVVVLAALIVPSTTLIICTANRAACGKNQRSIVAACIAYSQEQGGFWPIGCQSPSFPAAVKPGMAAAIISGRSFEVLAHFMNLGNSLFRCRQAQYPSPVKKPRKDWETNSSDPWGWGNSKIPYAYDWSVPTDPAPNRIVIADREIAHHVKGVAVVCADGAWRFIKINSNAYPQGGISCDHLGAPISHVIADGPATDLGPADNIFDDNGDNVNAGDGLTPLAGSKKRTYLK
jgi:hypothetical protein